MLEAELTAELGYELIETYLATNMSKVNHSISDKMSAHEISIFPFKSDEQGTKFINPSKRPLTSKSPFVNIRVKISVCVLA